MDKCTLELQQGLKDVVKSISKNNILQPEATIKDIVEEVHKAFQDSLKNHESNPDDVLKGYAVLSDLDMVWQKYAEPHTKEAASIQYALNRLLKDINKHCAEQFKQNTPDDSSSYTWDPQEIGRITAQKEGNTMLEEITKSSQKFTTALAAWSSDDKMKAVCASYESGEQEPLYLYEYAVDQVAETLLDKTASDYTEELQGIQAVLQETVDAIKYARKLTKTASAADQDYLANLSPATKELVFKEASTKVAADDKYRPGSASQVLRRAIQRAKKDQRGWQGKARLAILNSFFEHHQQMLPKLLKLDAIAEQASENLANYEDSTDAAAYYLNQYVDTHFFGLDV